MDREELRIGWANHAQGVQDPVVHTRGDASREVPAGGSYPEARTRSRCGESKSLDDVK